MTGFLEIFICSIIGLGILEVEEKTRMDELTVMVTISYLIALFLFSLTIIVFNLDKSRILVDLKNARDQYEMLKIYKLIVELEQS